MKNTKSPDEHETKTCPRCGGSFVCKANSVERCDCRSVVLTRAASAQIRKRYDGCLCMACLCEIQRKL
jgi:hypothetical protein